MKFAVSEAKNRQLQQMMSGLGILEEHLEERFSRSSGCGGQHVNKTSTSVQIIHLPTGIESRCSTERSQSLNRFLARRDLFEKIARHLGIKTEEDRRISRLKKQKDRRRRRVKKERQQEYSNSDDNSQYTIQT